MDLVTNCGEEFLYCVKAAGCGGGSATPGGHTASGRSHPPLPSQQETNLVPQVAMWQVDHAADLVPGFCSLRAVRFTA